MTITASYTIYNPPQIGDRVDFPIRTNGLPMWDCKYIYAGHLNIDCYIEARVREVNIDDFWIEYIDPITKRTVDWKWPMPSDSRWDNNRVGWIKRIATSSIDIVKPVITIPVIVHTEVLTAIKSHHEIPVVAIEQAYDRGERAIRRRLREWPHGKQLKNLNRPSGNTMTIEWWFENDSTSI